MLGTSDAYIREPVYYIEDCQISGKGRFSQCMMPAGQVFQSLSKGKNYITTLFNDHTRDSIANNFVIAFFDKI